MSILASLVRAYERLPEAPPFGYSVQNIGVIVGLNPDGSVASVTDWRVGEGRKRNPRPMLVPQPVKRTSGADANFLWDKTAYTLGVTADSSKSADKEHAEFKEHHRTSLEGTDDPGLKALLLFLQTWSPDQFKPPMWNDEFRDQNVAFVLEADRLQGRWLHERQKAKALWKAVSAPSDDNRQICLVSGEFEAIARLHPSIMGVWGGQSSGGSIVAFNKTNNAFESYGHVQGDNAPVSEMVAFAYTTALNAFLKKDSGHRIQIGDASTVFWADASEAEVAKEAEALFTAMFGGETVDETAEAKKIGILLEQLKKGEPLETLESRLEDGVRFHVLGLAPNAARISIRFHYDNDFRELARNYQDYVGDLRFEPRSKDRRITIYNLVLRTAPARRDRNKQIKFDSGQISPLLAGELFRSILTGDRFPRALLAQILMRVRSDQLLDNLRISMIKAVIVRAMRKEGRLPKEDYLVRSDPDDPNTARRLGKLFALIERAQLAALGDEINTTVKDKYLGTCAATPAQVISKLILNAEQHHLKRLRNGHSDAGWIKDAHHARRVGAAINRDLGRLAASFGNNFPAQHSDEEQGLFLIGYYQERYGSRKADDDGGDPSDDEQTKEGEE